MKRVTVLALIMATVLSGCANLEVAPEDIQPESNIQAEEQPVEETPLEEQPKEEKVEEIAVEEADWDALLAGEISFKNEEGIEITINDIPDADNPLYTFADVDNDGEDELCYRTRVELLVINHNSKGYSVIYTGASNYEYPVATDEKHGMYYHYDGAAPMHDIYMFRELDDNGNVISKHYFSRYDANEDGVYDQNDKYYFREDENLEMNYGTWYSHPDNPMMDDPEIQWIGDTSAYNVVVEYPELETGEALTEEELEQFEEFFSNIENYGFTLSSYKTPEEISWYYVFNCEFAGIESCEYSRDALNTFLKEMDYEELDPSVDPKMVFEGLKAVRGADIKKFVKEKTGISDFDVTTLKCATYIESEDVFFDFCDPFIYEDCTTCIQGVRNGDKISILIQPSAFVDHRRIITLEETGDSNNPYRFCSNRELWQEDVIKTIKAKNYDTGETTICTVRYNKDKEPIVEIIENDAVVNDRVARPDLGKTKLSSDIKDIAFCDVDRDGYLDMVSIWKYGSRTVALWNRGYGAGLRSFNKNNTDVTEWLSKNVSDMTIDNVISYMSDHQDKLNDFVGDKQNKTEKTASTETEEDFNDFVEVSFEPKEYSGVSDGKPDYSGIYCLDGYSTTYGYCKLIKQKYGSYYCEIYSYRVINFDCKATYKSDNLLEIQDDDYTGTISIDDRKATVSVSYNGGKREEYVFGSHKYDMPDLDKYIGVYKYTTKDGDEITITVGYDEKRVPQITVESKEGLVTFEHMPSDRGIWNFEDECYGDVLYADIEDEAWAPDSKVFNFTKNYTGDKYIVIDQKGDTPKVYYKTYTPTVMH